jgi:SNF2 family DNA or RNA helicase
MQPTNPELTQQPTPELNEKELRVLGKLQHVPGLVLAHGLGTGKTRTSLQVANALGNPTNVVVPAALQENYRKELKKWLGNVPENFNIQSQQRAATKGLTNPQYQTLVVDEAHRARDPQSKLLRALSQSEAGKKLLLTASPVYNHPADISALINLAAGKEVLPEDRKAFEEQFVKEQRVDAPLWGKLVGLKPGTTKVLSEDPRLKNAVKKYVDYQAGQAEGFPAFKEQEVPVTLGSKQQDIYDTILNKAPLWVKWKVKMGLPPGKSELQSLAAFLTGPRQVSNSTYDFVTDKSKTESPKIQKAFDYLKTEIDKNPRYKGVVYSNYLGSGLAPYKTLLDQNKIPYGEFSGDIPAKQRDQIIRDYNTNKLKALLISSAGAEGLDLKGTRLLQILEPHFNKEKEKQIVGRAIRYMSHAALPQDEQNVLIQRYLSKPKGGFLDRLFGRETVKGTDEYISSLADQKEKLNQQLLTMISKYGK